MGALFNDRTERARKETEKQLSREALMLDIAIILLLLCALAVRLFA